MAKEYLKMADVFNGPAMVASCFAYTTKQEEIMPGKFAMVNSESLQCNSDGVAVYAANAINSHDELAAEVERLREMICRMGMYLEMSGEHPEKESDNPIRQWLYDSIEIMKK